VSYRAVVFDLFLTLVYDVGTGTRDEAIRMAEAAGIPESDWLRAWRARMHDTWRGRIPSLRARVMGSPREAAPDKASDALADDLTGLLLVRSLPRIYPDVREALAELRRRGYAIALISNIQPNERLWVVELELAPLFDAIVLSCEVDMMKPEREIYLLAAERLSVAPEECVFVDDQPPFLQTARELGMAAVRIDRPHDDDHPSEGSGHDLRIENLRELLDWLPARAGGAAGKART
jgi:putative hydrolase of the HAD superfamily